MICIKRKPKILLCTEARITKEITYSEYNIDGYTAVVCHSQSRFTGGAIVYIQNSVKFKVFENIYQEKLIRCLSIEILDNSIKRIFAVIYRSPAFCFSDCREFFDEFLEKTIKLNKMNIIVGDINVNMNEINTSSRALNCLFDRHGLNLIVDFNTRVTNISQTLIDLVITNKPESVSCSTIPNEKITDHETIGIIIAKEKSEIVSHECVLSWTEYNSII